MDPRVELVVCLLCTDFANTVIWQSWRSDDGDGETDEKRIGFVTHPRPENVRFVPYSVDDPGQTQWGDNSLVHAELRLITDALNRFPNARQLLIVSGDTVPIRTKEDFLSFYLDDCDVSSVTLFADVRPVNPQDPWLTNLRINRLYCGHQFIALSRKHAEYLVSPEGVTAVLGMNNIQYYSPRYEANFSPDEVHLQTVLANRFPRTEFYNHRFVEFIADGRHAKTLTSDEFVTLYNECVQTDTLYCIRKVSKQVQWEVFKFLGEMGVVNHP